MNHIRLDTENDAVKQFFRSLPADPQGSVLELEGHAVACVLAIAPEGEGGGHEEWTEAKNARRCALIDREIAGSLTPQETVELYGLQRDMLNYRRRVAPLPLEDARKLHQQLLERANAASTGE